MNETELITGQPIISDFDRAMRLADAVSKLTNARSALSSSGAVNGEALGNLAKLICKMTDQALDALTPQRIEQAADQAAYSEVNNGKELARQLVNHLMSMGAESAQIPVSHIRDDGFLTRFSVTVTRVRPGDDIPHHPV